jgi:hypothetical protein
LQASAAAGPLLRLLANEEEEIVRLELALALARLAGEEHYFVQLARQMKGDAGTVLAQAVTAVARKWSLGEETAVAAALALSQNNLADGLALFSQLLSDLPLAQLPETPTLILAECGERIGEWGNGRLEYVALALHWLATLSSTSA